VRTPKLHLGTDADADTGAGAGSRALGKVPYALVFTVALPAALTAWSVALDAKLPSLPAIPTEWRAAGWAAAAAGLLLMKSPPAPVVPTWSADFQVGSHAPCGDSRHTSILLPTAAAVC
jgi:hypothetical protein